MEAIQQYEQQEDDDIITNFENQPTSLMETDNEIITTTTTVTMTSITATMEEEMNVDKEKEKEKEKEEGEVSIEMELEEEEKEMEAQGYQVQVQLQRNEEEAEMLKLELEKKKNDLFRTIEETLQRKKHEERLREEEKEREKEEKLSEEKDKEVEDKDREDKEDKEDKEKESEKEKDNLNGNENMNEENTNEEEQEEEEKKNKEKENDVKEDEKDENEKDETNDNKDQNKDENRDEVFNELMDKLQEDEMMDLTSANQVENINEQNDDASEGEDQDLICKVCSQFFRSPKTLPCFHTFCLKCIQGFASQEYGDSSFCPLCQTEFSIPENGPQAIPPNPFIENLIQFQELKSKQSASFCEICETQAEATQYCVQCEQLFCDRCQKVHLRSKKTANDQFISKDEALKGKPSNRIVYCPRHPERSVDMLCKTCDVPICIDCTVDHDSHSIVPLTHIAGDIKVALQELSNNLLPRIKSLETGIGNVEESLHSIEQNANRTANEIKNLFKKFHQELKERENILLNESKEVKEQKKRALSAQLNSLRSSLESHQSCFGFTNKIVKEGNEIEILSIKKNILQRTETLLQQKHDTLPCRNTFIIFSPRNQTNLQNSISNFGFIPPIESLDIERKTPRGRPRSTGSPRSSLSQSGHPQIEIENSFLVNSPSRSHDRSPSLSPDEDGTSDSSPEKKPMIKKFLEKKINSPNEKGKEKQSNKVVFEILKESKAVPDSKLNLSFDQSDLVGEGYIKFRINNFKAFQDAEKSSSPQFKLAGKKWQISLSVTENEKDSFLNVFLACYSQLGNSDMPTHFSFCFIGEGGRSVFNETMHNYSSNGSKSKPDWGFKKFIPFSDLWETNPGRRFIIDGSLDLEIAIRVFANIPIQQKQKRPRLL